MEKDIIYKVNPSIEAIGHLIFEEKTVIRTKGKRKGIYKGNEIDITTQDTIPILKDRSPFIKLFLDTNALDEFVELSTTAQRVIVHIIKNKLEYEKGHVLIVLSTLAKEMNVSRTTVNIGINELVNNKWLYRSQETFKFWINLGLLSFGLRENIYEKETGANKVVLKADKL